MIKCFFLEATESAIVSLRRYVAGPNDNCPVSKTGYHNAERQVGHCSVAIRPDGCYEFGVTEWPNKADFPTLCACGFDFGTKEPYQVSHDVLYRRLDTGEELTLDKAPPGAMWFATWYEDIPSWCGPDGHALMVRCPDGHDWHVDGRASNCTLPNDNIHKCWVRHGDPRTGIVTVDKNGHTCSTGAGSILTKNWHGFLRDGYLVE